MWERIKKILQKQGGKCIIIEDNEPAYLVMKLEDFEGSADNNASETEEANRDIAEWKANQEKKAESKKSEAESQELKVEDLPF